VESYLLSQPGIQQAQVSFWPFWVNRVSKRLDRIAISIASGSLPQ